jgi:hypothetical protein
MVRYQKRQFEAKTDTMKDATKDSSASNQPKSSKSKPQKPADEPMVMMAIYPTSSQSNTARALASLPSNFNTDAVYELRDSFILDSGATGHICNNRARFIKYQPATEK